MTERAEGLDPFSRIERRIERAEAMSSECQQVFRGRFDELRERYGSLTFQLETSVIHGDANIGNVMRAADGRVLVLLLDLDNVAVGPPEWDLTLTATYYQRFSWHSEEEYRGFAAACGFDVMAWRGFEVLRDSVSFTWSPG